MSRHGSRRAGHVGGLRGKVAVVTGGASGIGLATVRRLVGDGATVAIWDLRPGDVVEQFSALGRETEVQVSAVDVRDREAVVEAAGELARRCGRIDILVNCAGVTLGYLELEATDDRAWRFVLDTNLRGVVHCAQAVLPHMRRQGSGHIVIVTSIIGGYGFPGQTAYAASKSALIGLTKTWARELGPSGIRVNAVSPGYIRTPMNERNPRELVSEVLARTPLARLGEPEEVASVVAFLCSGQASFIHGAVIAVDGGLVP